MPREPRLPTALLLAAAAVSLLPALLSGQRHKAPPPVSADPYTVDTAVAARCGHATATPFPWAEGHTTDDIQKLLGSVPLRWIETAHFRLGSNLPAFAPPAGDKHYRRRLAAELSRLTRMTFHEAPNHFEAQATADSAVEVSGALKTVAVSLNKIANDIRWLGSGPRAGLGELKLPAVQPGSSIMPGKVNPVICEALIQTCAQVIGNDAAITQGGLGGVFELNLMLPLVARNLLESVAILAGAVSMFREKLVEGLQADEERCADTIEGSLAMCTSLAPVIGYDAAAAIAKEAFATGKTVREVARAKEIISEEEPTRLLDPMSMTRPSD